MNYISLDLNTTKIFVFINGSFANNKDLSSQLGYKIIIVNKTTRDEEFDIKGNLLHYSSTKSKRVTRSILASEIYSIVGGVDVTIIISTIIIIITDQLGYQKPLIVIYTDLYSLYKYLVKLGTTKKKRLMIDIIALRQSYERQELQEIRWINSQDNPTDIITKSNYNKALQKFIDTNCLQICVKG